MFIKLAEPAFKVVWWRASKQRADATFLRTYAKGKKALSDGKRLKVAAYRHPDPYVNPIFCQFGVSRPAIEFRRLKNFTSKPAGQDPRSVGLLLWNGMTTDLRILHGVGKRLDREIGTSCDTSTEGSGDWPSVPRRHRLGRAVAAVPENKPARVADVFDRKHQKRKSSPTNESDDDTGDVNETEGAEKEPRWNGSLVANRRQLQRIKALLDTGRNSEAEKVRCRQLHWHLVVSMDLAPQGPWPRWAFPKGLFQENYDRELKKRVIAIAPPNSNMEWRGLAFPFEHPLNATESKRNGRACHILSCLDAGLRILSVDLGRRYGAACAVWETLSEEQFRQELETKCAEGWSVTTTSNRELFVVLEGLEKASKRVTKKAKRADRTTHRPHIVYRRISNSAKPGVATWARLDRQFVVKLQGESDTPRFATDEERERVKQFERTVGYNRVSERRASDWVVDQLMSEVVDIARLALRRHSDRAKIAFGLTTCFQPLMGDQQFSFNKQPNDSADETQKRRAKHIEYIQDLLGLWHGLATSPRWKDAIQETSALRLWNEALLQNLSDLPPTQSATERQVRERLPEPKDEPDDLTKPERRKRRDALHAALKPLAEYLVDRPKLRKELCEKWIASWQCDDGSPATTIQEAFTPTDRKGKQRERKGGRRLTKPDGWFRIIRELSDWLLGHDGGKHRRRVGGLSLTRIDTIKALYRLQKSFLTRFTPWGRQLEMHNDDGMTLNAVERWTRYLEWLQSEWRAQQDDFNRKTPPPKTAATDFARGMLRTVEQLRANRLKQLASRIVEAALGVGIEREGCCGRDVKRPQTVLFDPQTGIGDRRFKACEAVVIENLSGYKTKETRLRRENRMLAGWSKAEFSKFLAECCQLHGLHLRSVPAQYTSQQDSRTGGPGIRCEDVALKDLLAKKGRWANAIRAARKRTAANKANGRDGYLLAVYDYWQSRPDSEREPDRAIRVPTKGGEVFVSAVLHSPTAQGLQADLNAAANIGLKALLDPDWQGAWWYFPASLKDGYRVPKKETCDGALWLNDLKLGRVPDNNGSYRQGGDALSLESDDAVQVAKKAAKDAAQVVEDDTAALNALRKQRPKNPDAITAAKQQVAAAKESEMQAKTTLKKTTMAARQKPQINLWQSLSERDRVDGTWHDHGKYWAIVEQGILQVLREHAERTALSLPEPNLADNSF